jgi:hypothetical protein
MNPNIRATPWACRQKASNAARDVKIDTWFRFS